jgi:pyruvate kinase
VFTIGDEMRRTKIVATLGPASTDAATIEKLILGGMDVVRLNFSHGTKEEHRKRLDTVRKVAQRLGRPVACLQDLSGPKIRTGLVSGDDGVHLEPGSTFILTTDDVLGTSERVSASYPELPNDARPGNRILLDDGLIELEVEAVSGHDVRTRVVSGGILKSRKGINLPGFALSVPSLTDKDREDLAFGLSLDVDFMALSFVRTGDDIRALKSLLAEHDRRDLPVIAKIEKPEAIDNLNSILELTDSVMVARGDLGVEIAAEKVPTLQKEIIRQANEKGRVVITATQMLESMVSHPRPTRAEASDVANAILDGTDAVMLSAESAVGRYPVESVRTMARIAAYTEDAQDEQARWKRQNASMQQSSLIPRAAAMAACGAAEQLHARYIVAFTESGATARLVSQFRPRQPVLAMTPSERVYRQLALPWGVTPHHLPRYDRVDEMFQKGMELLQTEKRVSEGDLVVGVFGTSPVPGATSMIKIHKF